MIVLSVGMPRAGSGWYYNLAHDFIVGSGGQDVHQIRKRFHLDKILTEVNCNIGVLSVRRLLAVLIPSILGNTFVIKAHAAPTPFVRTLIQRNLIFAAYIYRDPRDALLSSFENGQRAREKGFQNAFSSLANFDASLQFMQEYIHVSEAWLDIPGALHTRYESLVTDYDLEAERLLDFLQIEKTAPAVINVLQKYRPEQAAADQKGLHFRKGKTGRFRLKMSTEEQDSMNTTFASYLRKMGYDPQ